MADLSDEERQALSELLPFYLNGTLDAAETAQVEAALAQDALLRADLDFLKGVRDETRARDVGRSPGEFGLARLLRDVEKETPQATARSWVQDSRVWQFATAACLALLVGTSALLVTNPDTVAELASGGVVTIHEGPVLTVAFVETASEAEIRDLLLSLELEIAAGPSALGLYTLVGPEGANVDDLLVILSAMDTIVESAEEEG